MVKIFSDRKKIISLLACIVFIAGALVLATASFLKSKIYPTIARSSDLKNDQKQDNQSVVDGCVIDEEKQNQDNDVLFVGCNGFF